MRVAREFIVVDAAHGFDGEAAGFLPAFISAHAIGDDGQTAFAQKVIVGVGLPVKKGVFVIGALAAYVGQAGGFDARLGSCVLYIHR